VYAFATVAGLTCSAPASTRTGGSRLPQSIAPRRTPDSMLSEIASALDPLT
jgi:hypothetical protein